MHAEAIHRFIHYNDKATRVYRQCPVKTVCRGKRPLPHGRSWYPNIDKLEDRPAIDCVPSPGKGRPGIGRQRATRAGMSPAQRAKVIEALIQSRTARRAERQRNAAAAAVAAARREAEAGGEGDEPRRVEKKWKNRAREGQIEVGETSGSVARPAIFAAIPRPARRRQRMNPAASITVSAGASTSTSSALGAVLHPTNANRRARS